MTRLARLTAKTAAVAAFLWGAAWLTGCCCCCGSGTPEVGGEFVVRAPGRSTLPDVGELRQTSAPDTPQRY